jgi:hypothetical protein
MNLTAMAAGLGPEVHLGAEVDVAEVVAGPRGVDAGIPIDKPAVFRVGIEQRPDVAVDARIEEHRPEDFRAAFDAVCERAGEVANVGVALNIVGASTVAADRPLAFGQYLGRGHEPQTRIAEEGRRGRACVICSC